MVEGLVEGDSIHGVDEALLMYLYIFKKYQCPPDAFVLRPHVVFFGGKAGEIDVKRGFRYQF